jgi:hypothetical protein
MARLAAEMRMIVHRRMTVTSDLLVLQSEQNVYCVFM